MLEERSDSPVCTMLTVVHMHSHTRTNKICRFLGFFCKTKEMFCFDSTPVDQAQGRVVIGFACLPGTPADSVR